MDMDDAKTKTITLLAYMDVTALAGRRFMTDGGLTISIHMAWHSNAFSGVGFEVTTHRNGRTNRTAFGLPYGAVLVESPRAGARPA
jgi:hypothetical protein